MAPITLGRMQLPAHADVHLSDRRDGTRQLDAAARLGANFQRFNLATAVRYRKQLLDSGGGASDVSLDLLGSGRVGEVRLRGGTTFEIAPGARFRTAELSAYWSASDTVDWEGGLAYDAVAKRGRARVSHIRRLNSMAILRAPTPQRAIRPMAAE